jgi:uncharacterized iron-regulated membrane protein
MMRWLRRLHAWIGLGLCLFLALIALTGASLVFRPQIRDLGRPPPQAPAPSDLAGIVALAEARFGPGEIVSIVFASREAAWSEVRLRDGRHAWVDHHAGTVRDFGAVDGALEWLFDLHHQLLGGETGERVVGSIGAAGALMALSGLVLWWPARRTFGGAALPRRPGRAGWLSAHRDLAIMAAPMVILSLTTGASLALPDIIRPLFAAPAPAAPKDVAIGAGAADWPAAFAAAQARWSGATIRMAIPAARPGAPASLRLRQPEEWHANGRTVVYFDPPSGRIVGAYDAQAQGASARAYNSAWPLHAAKVGGLIWKVLIFLGGLSLAALSLYGGEAYRRRLMKG